MSDIEAIRIFLAVILTAHVGTIILFVVAYKLGARGDD
jgi:hypothetical protein